MPQVEHSTEAPWMSNDHWPQETQAVPLVSEILALISLLAELTELTADGNGCFYT